MCIWRSLCFRCLQFIEDLLYEDILMEFHVYDTQDYFNTTWQLLILIEFIFKKWTNIFAIWGSI